MKLLIGILLIDAVLLLCLPLFRLAAHLRQRRRRRMALRVRTALEYAADEKLLRASRLTSLNLLFSELTRISTNFQLLEPVQNTLGRIVQKTGFRLH